MIKKHNLKIWPEYFKQSQLGYKNFELRLNDRDFRIGDILLLREWDPEIKEYTSEYLIREITYILRGPILGLASEYCILGLRSVYCRECKYYQVREKPYPSIEKDMYCSKRKFGVDIEYKSMMSCSDFEPKPLWRSNILCPQCGKEVVYPPKIKACETGYSYCSEECAKKHVRENEPEGGY